jgi:hypothetical protein
MGLLILIYGLISDYYLFIKGMDKVEKAKKTKKAVKKGNDHP